MQTPFHLSPYKATTAPRIPQKEKKLKGAFFLNDILPIASIV
jgi:hypothetical protein